MTAEVALLSKVAVALAADSAATISAGGQDEKVFNSEDKLFELSNAQPIGVMIYGAPYFLETPIQILIKRYRSLGRHFPSIDEVAEDFKNYLNEFGLSLDHDVRARSYNNLVDEVWSLVIGRVSEKMQNAKDKDSLNFQDVMLESIEFYVEAFVESGNATFLDGSAEAEIRKILARNKGQRKNESKEEKDSGERIDRMMSAFMRSAYPSGAALGIVIAGYCDKELFPSLRSFQVDGMVGNTLRILETKSVDILYGGPNAKVVPFAQQDMVDRFVSGIDVKSQDQIENTCKDLLEAYRQELLQEFDLRADESAILEERLVKAEEVFMQGVHDQGFARLEERAEREIESMVEFMPKPDLAQMAEALVEITSIKRRVTKGFDTVGGPIDVAVISRSEGFVWVKRKHYFDLEKNQRYIAKLSKRLEEENGAAKPYSANTSKKGEKVGSGSASGRRGAERGQQVSEGVPAGATRRRRGSTKAT